MQFFADHNHEFCIDKATADIAQYCDARGLRLTKVRTDVLHILLSEHKALGAYDILEKLAHVHPSAKPPTVYRALEFLMKHGFAHKVERLNAYVACTRPGQDHAPAFMICRSCKTVAESRAPRRDSALHEAAAMAGFEIEETVLEAQGLCPLCRGTTDE